MQQNTAMYFTKQLVLRTPALPFTVIEHVEQIQNLITDSQFMEAIQLASPVLYKECMKWKSGALKEDKAIRKIVLSLTKYYQRMSGRCTPFGLFSGCSVVQWGAGETCIQISASKFNRSTRLDMHYLCALALKISSVPAIRSRLKFFPNNSCYNTAGELRYIEYNYEQGARMYKISSVRASDWVDKILTIAKNGSTITHMAAPLLESGVTENDAREFINDLIDNQLLISELDPKITGEEYMRQVLKVLYELNNPAVAEITGLASLLDDILTELKQCDWEGIGNNQRYTKLAEKIKQTGVAFDEGRLLQTDRFPVPVTSLVNNDVQEKLFNVIQTLLPLSHSTSETNLTSFANKFRNRYENKEIPLLQVLDTETGIGYTQEVGKNLSPLIDALALPPGDRHSFDIKWNKKEQWLFDLLVRSQHDYEIELPVHAIPAVNNAGNLPPSMSVMFSLAENGKLIFRGATGSSAINILSRFAYGDAALKELCAEVANSEEENNPDVIIGEIIHLPEDRVGNILQHPAFRTYEIPFLASPSVNTEYQIPLQDILVSVHDGKVILRSASLKKQVIPRLSNAHNFSFRSLPVYQFLCDMQFQDLTNTVMFSWGVMAPQFKFLPRVKTGDVILAEATWQLNKDDYSTLLSGNHRVGLRSFLSTWKMPRMVVLADGDNELLVDWESDVSVMAFLAAIAKREKIILKEFLPPDATAVTGTDGRPYCNQFVAALINSNQVLHSFSVKGAEAKEKPQTGFLPGSEWLYYKIYCGTKSADDILNDIIRPLVTVLKEKKLIDKWFFIRYIDPDFHIRLRLHLCNTESYGAVAAICVNYFQPGLDKGLLWKLQLDTYFRELERYGDSTIAVAEDLFCYDSELKLKFLQLTEGDEREILRWQWGMRGVDELLNTIGYSLEKKHSLMQFFRNAFAAEFNADKNLFKQINLRYNLNKQLVQTVMENQFSVNDPLKPLLELYDESRDVLRKLIADLKLLAGANGDAAMDGWIGSYIHMNLNRLFLSEPRLHELVLYDFLCSWYRTCINRK